jgi:hypothetical protein
MSNLTIVLDVRTCREKPVESSRREELLSRALVVTRESPWRS